MSWPQILAPLYAAAGVVFVVYGWRSVIEDLRPQFEAQTPIRRVAVIWIFAMTLFALWPAFFLVELYRYVTSDQS
jgi:uncharacterized membrane protein